MIYLPKIFINISTFPGIIIRVLSEHLFCIYFNIPIYKISYFNLLESDHIIRGEPDKYREIFLINISPIIINTFISFLISFPFVLGYFDLIDSYRILYTILLYIGITIGYHAIPTMNQFISIIFYIPLFERIYIHKKLSFFFRGIIILFIVIISILSIPIRFGYAILICILLPEKICMDIASLLY